MSKITKNLTLAISTISVLALSSPAFAAFGFGIGGSGVQTDFNKAFRTIFNVAVGLAGIIFVVLFLVGGIQYLTSAGNEDSATAAKKLLVNAVIGLVIVFIAYAGGTFLITQLFGDTGIVPSL